MKSSLYFISVSIGGGFLDDGGLGSLGRGTITDKGLVGSTVVGLADGINNVVCTTFGPNFLKILLKNHTCPREAIAPTKCETWPEFCKLYNSAPPCIQDCLSASAIDIEVKLNGLVGGHDRLGKCCCRRDLDQVSTNILINANLLILILIFYSVIPHVESFKSKHRVRGR